MKTLKNLTILYVENEPTMIEKYLPFLESHCAKLYATSNASEASYIYKDKQPHIIIMDLYVAKFNDVTLAKKLREEGDYQTALIALTTHANREMLLEIVDLHFSSYLIKPVDRTALLKALLKVAKKVSIGKVVHLACSCSWDSQSKTLFYKEQQVVLTKREQRLFELFVEKAGMACSDDEIFFHVWEDDFSKTITNASIRTLIKNLRKKLPKELIENQYGVGYKINL